MSHKCSLLFLWLSSLCIIPALNSCFPLVSFWGSVSHETWLGLPPKYLTVGCSLTFKPKTCQAHGGGHARGQPSSGGPAPGEAWQQSGLSGGMPLPRAVSRLFFSRQKSASQKVVSPRPPAAAQWETPPGCSSRPTCPSHTVSPPPGALVHPSLLTPVFAAVPWLCLVKRLPVEMQVD